MEVRRKEVYCTVLSTRQKAGYPCKEEAKKGTSDSEPGGVIHPGPATNLSKILRLSSQNE